MNYDETQTRLRDTPIILYMNKNNNFQYEWINNNFENN